ncbi:MAG: HlyD family efflux transporter periplasmic adaptor subunit [candidate division Zixibacteria bacterium]|nr:HlyD family efflux transporter periplasmic adaptor subunit [candidate division Zixibacteria bacterium]
MSRYIVIILLLSTGLIGCGNNDGLVGGSGLIEASESVISAESAGRVVQHNFDEGTSVSIGDTLVVIDTSNLELELVAARAGLDVLRAQLAAARVQVKQTTTAQEFAQSEFARVERLMQSGTATQKQFDQVQFERNQASLTRESSQAQVHILDAQLAKTEADIARLERRRADCFARSPLDGIVTEKFVEPGELLSPGKAIARIARLDTVTVKVYLTTDRFAGVKLGDRAMVSTESDGKEYPGTVIWTSDKAEFTPKNVQTEEARADLVYAVKVSIPNPDRTLKVGMPVFVTLEK